MTLTLEDYVEMYEEMGKVIVPICELPSFTFFDSRVDEVVTADNVCFVELRDNGTISDISFADSGYSMSDDVHISEVGGAEGLQDLIIRWINMTDFTLEGIDYRMATQTMRGFIMRMSGSMAAIGG